MMGLVRYAPYRGAILLSVLISLGTISGDWGEKERQKTHFSRLPSLHPTLHWSPITVLKILT